MSAKGTVLLFGVVVVLAGVPFLFIKIAVEDVSPIHVVFARLLVASAIAPFLLRRASARRAIRRRIRILIPFAVLDPLIPFLLVATAEQDVDSGTAGVIIASTPIWVAFLSSRVAGSARGDWTTKGGLALGLVGVAVVLAPEPSSVNGDLMVATSLLAIAAVSYAAASIYFASRCHEIDPAHAVAATLVLDSAILLIPALILLPGSSFTVPALGSLAVLGVACTAGGLVGYYALIRRIGPERASLTAYLAPIVSVIAGATFLGEELTVRLVTGAALIILGSSLAGRQTTEPLPAEGVG